MVWEGKRTICEVLRECGDKCAEVSENLALGHEMNVYETTDIIFDLLYKISEAADMAKRMSNKLREYKDQYDEGWWAEKTEQTEIGG